MGGEGFGIYMNVQWIDLLLASVIFRVDSSELLNNMAAPMKEKVATSTLTENMENMSTMEEIRAEIEALTKQEVP